MSRGGTVTLLLSASGQVRSVHESQADAEEQRNRYNADPFIAEGQADPDAPYSVETWAVMTPVRRAKQPRAKRGAA